MPYIFLRTSVPKEHEININISEVGKFLSYSELQMFR